jgi:hypothetical protein
MLYLTRTRSSKVYTKSSKSGCGDPGINFTLSVCSCYVSYFLPSDMIIYANRQQDGEIEVLNRTISNLRDYVVDTGQYLTRDQPFL